MSWWKSLFSKGASDAQMNSELRFHIDELTEAISPQAWAFKSRSPSRSSLARDCFSAVFKRSAASLPVLRPPTSLHFTSVARGERLPT